jgi:ribosome biogenesis GTPase / thiamine phosphate phosphatase
VLSAERYQTYLAVLDEVEGAEESAQRRAWKK